jgi:hypothetical protein
MKNDYFDFCALCFRSNETGASNYYCALHQPKSNLYNRDRNRLIQLEDREFRTLTGHKAKIKFLSELIDGQATPPFELTKTVRRIVINKKLSFNSCIGLIDGNYSHAAKKLEDIDFKHQKTISWVCEYLKNLGLIESDYKGLISDSTDNEIFDILIYISARYHATEHIKVKVPDGRQKDKSTTLSENERSRYLSIISKMQPKPNGRISRVEFAVAAGIHRRKGERIIKKLKTDGHLKSNI